MSVYGSPERKKWNCIIRNFIGQDMKYNIEKGDALPKTFVMSAPINKT